MITTASTPTTTRRRHETVSCWSGIMSRLKNGRKEFSTASELVRVYLSRVSELSFVLIGGGLLAGAAGLN